MSVGRQRDERRREERRARKGEEEGERVSGGDQGVRVALVFRGGRGSEAAEAGGGCGLGWVWLWFCGFG